MRIRHGFDICGDQVALRQNVEHAFALRHAVTGSRDAESSRDTAGGPDAFLDKFGQIAEDPVSRVHVRIRIRDPDNGLLQILAPIPAGIHQAHEVSFLGIGWVMDAVKFTHRFLISRNLRPFYVLKLLHSEHIQPADQLQVFLG